MIASNLEVVKIGGDEVQAVRGPDGEGYVVLRRMCEVLGIDAESERQKLLRQTWACTCKIQAHDTLGREQSVFCLHIKSVPMWLAGIDIGRVDKSAQPRIVEFQTKAAAILNAWAKWRKSYFSGATITQTTMT